MNRTTRADGYALVPRKKDRQRASFGTLPGEDASFNQLYSLQRIELTEKLRKNHGRDESWPISISLKMAELVPAKKSSSGGRCNHPADRCKRNDRKDSIPAAGDPHFCSRQVCLRARITFRNDSDLSHSRSVHRLRISCE